MPPARAHSEGVSPSRILAKRARTSAIGAHPPAAAGDVATLGKMQKTCNKEHCVVAPHVLHAGLRRPWWRDGAAGPWYPGRGARRDATQVILPGRGVTVATDR